MRCAVFLLLGGCGLTLDYGPPGDEVGGPPDCSAIAETCNGADDDCDGRLDEGIAPARCGVGACETLVEACVDGAPVACVAETPQPEACNAIDDDCDGVIDNGCTCERYVLLDATGSGTAPNDPMGSIQDAVFDVDAEGGGTVCVGASSSESGSCGSMYQEHVDMHEGVNVFGGYEPADDVWTVNPDCRTTIAPPDADPAVSFGPELTNATILGTFLVRGRAGYPEGHAILFEGGGTLEDVIAKGEESGLSAGVLVTLDPRPLPVEIRRGYIEGGSGPMVDESYGLLAFGPVLVTDSSHITAGDANVESVGVVLEDAPGSELIAVGSIESGDVASGESTAIQMAGDVDGVVLRGPTDIRGGTAASGESTGIRIDGAGSVLIEGARIAGGPAQRGGSQGVYVSGGADALMEANERIAGLYAGRSSEAYGVLCVEAGTHCVVESNVAVAGTAGGAGAVTAIGVAFFSGASGTIARNSIQGCVDGGVCGGITLNGARTPVEVDSNTVLESRPISSDVNIGIRIFDAEVLVQNNLVRVAPGSDGILAVPGRTAPDAIVVQWNTVVGLTGRPPAMGTFTALLAVEQATFDGSSAGEVRNNILWCMRDSAMIAVEERGRRPAIFDDNILYGCNPVYRGTRSLNLSAGQLWMFPTFRPSFVGNREVNPMLDASFRLMAGSPAIDTASGEGAPMFDFEGDPRPAGAGYDVGWDEH